MENFAKIIPILSKTVLFTDIKAEKIYDLLSNAQLFFRDFDRGTLFLFQGDLYPALCIMVEGTCISEMNDLSGKTMMMGKFQAPYTIAPGFLFLEKSELPVSLRAETKVRTVFLSRNTIFDLCKRHDCILKNYLQMLSERVEYLTKRVSFYSFKTIREKLLYYLTSLDKEAEDTVYIPMSIESLAQYFGVTRPALSQVFIDLQQEELIDKEGRCVRLHYASTC